MKSIGKQNGMLIGLKIDKIQIDINDNTEEIKNLILSLVQDVVFEYDNKTCCINPWSRTKFEVGYNDIVKIYSDIDDLMNDTIFDGRSLSDIADEIEIE